MAHRHLPVRQASRSSPGEQLTAPPDAPTITRMKGDRIEILVDIGNGVRGFDVVATKAGRRVESSVARGLVEVVEVTRTGTVVRTASFMSTRVVALVEHPAEDIGP
jgi:hypothetical protein